MIIEEGTVIILDGGYRYYLVEEIGQLDEYPNKTYYFAAGITNNDKINTNDICFIEIEKEGKEIYATKVDENSDVYETLSAFEVLSIAVAKNPTLKDSITENLNEE